MPIDVNPDDLIPEIKAAKLLHQKPKTLLAWRHRRIGPSYIKIGRQIFYSRTDLVQWITTQRVIPGPRPNSVAGAAE
jgi:hypothetical protein